MAAQSLVTCKSGTRAATHDDLATRGSGAAYPAYAQRFLNASEELLRHALKADLAH